MRGCWVLWLLGLVLLEVWAHDQQPYDLQIPGRSAGIPPCNGQTDSVNCHRTDDPLPPDICIRRDPDTQDCLETIKVQAYESEFIARRAEAQHVFLPQSHRGLPKTCDFQDPTCVPDGVHLTQEIDWRKVEGAEFVTTATRVSSEGVSDIFVDSNHGCDQRGRGTREAPYKSIRSGLRKWLTPGKCHPYCSSTSLTTSGTVHLSEGVYWGRDNTEIEVMIVKGVKVVIQCNELGNKDTAFEYKRRTNVEVKVADFSHWLSMTGKGSVSLLGLTVSNTSSDALKVAEGIDLQLDLHYLHGMFGSVKQTITESVNATNVTNATEASIVRSPAWDTSSDQRVVGRNVNCDTTDGCVVGTKIQGFDKSHYGPLEPSSSRCEHCHVAVKTDVIQKIPETGYGLAVVVKQAGTGCENGGTLIATHDVPGRPGSGFSATFTVSNGAVSGVTTVDPGSGYFSAEKISIHIDIGGDSCNGVVFSPVLIYDPAFL